MGTLKCSFNLCTGNEPISQCFNEFPIFFYWKIVKSKHPAETDEDALVIGYKISSGDVASQKVICSKMQLRNGVLKDWIKIFAFRFISRLQFSVNNL